MAAVPAAHIEIEIFETWMSDAFARRSLAAMKLLAIPLVATLAWRLFASGASAREFGEATQQLLISYEPFYYAMGAMIALYAAILDRRPGPAARRARPRADAGPRGGRSVSMSLIGVIGLLVLFGLLALRSARWRSR